MTRLFLALLLLPLCGCFAAPLLVQNNSRVEKDLWMRYAMRTQAAIAERDNAIRKVGAKFSDKLLQNDLAQVAKMTDAQGKADAQKLTSWVLDSVALRDQRNALLEAEIKKQDAKIAEDQTLVNAALGLHDLNQKWLAAGPDSSAVGGGFDLLDSILGDVVKPKPPSPVISPTGSVPPFRESEIK